jgi:drug/metabolite transporter superfamily protein YnfA
MTDIVLSIVMLAALALVAGAILLWRRTGEVKNPALMLLLAVIAVVNVLIWTLPSPGGKAPIEQIKAAGER